jgi:hypothetical protein
LVQQHFPTTTSTFKWQCQSTDPLVFQDHQDHTTTSTWQPLRNNQSDAPELWTKPRPFRSPVYLQT